MTPSSAALPIISALALALSVAELAIAPRLGAGLRANLAVCRSYLCDDESVARLAFKAQFSGSGASLATANEALRDLLVRGSASPRRWLDLGDALAQADSLPEARLCFSRALYLGSISARILLDAAGFYQRDGDSRRGLSITVLKINNLV